MEKALVTGVAGFIGSHIAERLLKMGYAVIGIDDLSAGHAENIPIGVKFIHADIGNIWSYSKILEGVDVVFHQAASKKNICLKNPTRDMEVNGIATLTLLQECVRFKVRKFIHASTGSVYGEVKGKITERTPRNPCSFYGISKVAGESYVQLFHQHHGLNTTILRYFHVYGPRQEKNSETGGVVAIFSDRIQNGEPIIIHGNGIQKRVFTNIEDIVDANIAVMLDERATGQIYNCASSEQSSILHLALALMTRYKSHVEINYIAPLVGDIDNFDVDATKIEELGVTFKPLSLFL